MYTLCSPGAFSLNSTKNYLPLVMCLIAAESIHQELEVGSAIIASVIVIAISFYLLSPLIFGQFAFKCPTFPHLKHAPLVLTLPFGFHITSRLPFGLPWRFQLSVKEVTTCSHDKGKPLSMVVTYILSNT
jgi:hypothetical protein